jgi:hypothetical protein
MSNVVANMLGFTECEVCGKRSSENTKKLVGLWDYGVRVVKPRHICKSCHSAYKKGIL